MTERTSLTDADLDRIEAEANAATPGPWSASEAVEYRPRQGPFSDTGASIWSESQKHPSGDEQEVVAGGMQDEQGGAVGVLLNADARFIAASRTNVPTLIAEVRRLRARIRQLEDIVQWALDEGGWRLIYYSDPPPHDLVDTSDMFGGSEVKRYDTALASAGDAGRKGEPTP